MCNYESYQPDDIRLELEDNPVHTFLYLSGSTEALAQAAEIIRGLKKNGIEPKGQSYGVLSDEIREGTDGDDRWFEIVFDNHVPQIYEKLNAVKGIEKVLFVVYSSFDTFMNTNDVEGVMWKRRAEFGIPAELEVELVDDLVNDFPDTFDHASTNYK